MKRNLIVILVTVSVLLVGLVLWAVHSVPSVTLETPPESSTGNSTGSAPTQTSTANTTVATTPPVTVPPVSVPTIAENEYVGTLYTRAQLDAMDNSRQSVWPGYSNEGKRPSVVTAEHSKYNEQKAYFIGNNNSLVYLTFNCEDDPLIKDASGNAISHTTLILDTLKYQQIKATFFVTGSFCRTHPEMVQRIIDEGHILGNYGQSAVALPGLSTEEMVAQIMNLHTYVQEQFGYTMQYFRPYGGAYSQRTFALANSLGYTSILYSAAYPDKDDTSTLTISQATEMLTSQIHKGAVFRLHTASSVTVSILKDLIDTLREGYYRISLYQP